MAHTCFSCGGPAAYIVVFPYNRGDPSGRLMLYCERCAGRPDLLVKLPIRILDEDPSATLEFLYGHGLTLTDPEMVAEMLGVAPGRWRVVADWTFSHHDIWSTPPGPSGDDLLELG